MLAVHVEAMQALFDNGSTRKTTYTLAEASAAMVDRVTLSKMGDLAHEEFLDLSRNNPSKAFAEAVVASCGEQGPIFVYNAKFEAGRLRELSAQFALLRRPLDSIIARLVDLLPIAEQFYYHPNQKGSWSIKAVLPAIVPSLSYENLPGVKDGGMAMDAYSEAINPNTTQDRREKIAQELLAYCKLDACRKRMD